jgi:hypothetical protein
MDTTNTSFALESVDELYANYIVNEKPLGPHPVQPTTWDFYFEVTSEEPREREFLQHPCVVHDSLPNNKLPPAKVSVAQAAIKVMFLNSLLLSFILTTCTDGHVHARQRLRQ